MIEFNGDWQYDLNLEILSTLNSDRFFGYESMRNHKERLNKGIISLIINDVRDLNPDPLPEQIETIKWIVDNQTTILKSLYHSIVETIFPYYKKQWGDEDDESNYPSLEDESELNKALGISSISIQEQHNSKFSYYTIYFDFCTDEEHGLAIVMHKERMVSFGAVGDLDNKGIIEDLGLNYDKWLEEWRENQSSKRLIFHRPIEKYQKLKPWQEQENRYFPYGLFHEVRYEELMQFIEDGNITVDGNSSTFLELAIRSNRESIIEFCLSKKPTKLYNPFIEAMNKNRFDLMDKIIDLGFSVNSEIAQRSPLYVEIGKLAKNIKNNEDTLATTKGIEYLFSKGINPFIKDKFGRDAFYRIKRIDEENIREKVTSLMESISKDYIKAGTIKTKPKWKFW